MGFITLRRRRIEKSFFVAQKICKREIKKRNVVSEGQFMTILKKKGGCYSMEEKTKTFFDLLGIDILKKRYYHCRKRNYPTQSSGKINTILQKKKRKENAWFCVNHAPVRSVLREGKKKSGETYMYRYTFEDRLKSSIKKFNAFYLDIDFKDEDGHHLSLDVVAEKKKTTLDKIKAMYLTPSAVVDTRNGLQIYYALHPKEKDEVTSEEWELVENSIYDYYKENITPYVDGQAKDVSRLLRIPGTIHKKPDTDPYNVEVIYLGSRCSFQDLDDAFDFVNHEEKKREIHKEKTHKQKLRETSGLLKALSTLDASYFDYVPKIDADLSVGEAARTIALEDVRRFLRIDVCIGESFSSVLREDNNPSCVVYTSDDGRFWYRDFAREERGFSLLDIVQNIANVEYMPAIEFLCRCYGIRLRKRRLDNIIQPDMDDIIAANVEILNHIVRENKELSYARKLKKTYAEIMSIWKSRQDVVNFSDPYDIDLLLSLDLLSCKVDCKQSTVKGYLGVMTYVGMLKKAKTGARTSKLKTPPTSYYIVDISDKKEDLIASFLKLREECDGNVYRNIGII